MLGELRLYGNDLAAARLERDALIVEHQAKLVIPDELQAEIAALELTVAGAELGLRVWAEKNRAAEFNGEQSLELEPGFLRFRKGKRSIGLLEGWTWAKVLESMKRGWKRYVRMLPEVDRQGLLLATSSQPNADTRASHPVKPKLDPKRLAEVGLAVVQEESFTVELKVLPGPGNTKSVVPGL